MDYRLLSRIYNCVKNGQVDSLRMYLEAYSPEDIRFDVQRTILHVAAFFNKPDIIQMSRNYGIVDNVQDMQGKTALLVAASKGHMRCVELLLTNDNIDIRDNRGMTPLLESYKNNHLAITSVLLRAGANYNHVANNSYRIPLGYVSRILPNARMPRRTPIVRPRERVRQSFTRVDIDNLFIRQAQRMITQEENRQREIDIFGSFVFEVPARPAVPLEPSAEMPAHFKNEFIEMAIALKKSCSICLEPFEKDKTVFTKCSHLLCSGCFQDSRLTKCPLCRIDIK